MKKLIYLFVVITTLFSCVIDDHVEDNNYTGDLQTYFTGPTLNKDVVVSATSSSLVMVEVGSTETSSSNRTYSITVDDSSTAVLDQDYSFSSSDVVINSGENVGYFEFNSLFNTMSDESVLVLNLIEVSDYVSTFKNQITINLSKACGPSFVSSLVDGTTYSVTTTYGFHDFLPDYSTNTAIVQITDLGGNMFSFSDFSGGLYSTGPYAPAYGTGGADNTLTFTDECNKIVWEGQTDPWGDILPINGGVNKIDVTSGVITISWTCTGYGENGVSVYTPQ